MKKIVTFIAAVAFSATAFAQFGVSAGGNYSMLISGDDNTHKPFFGYQIGVIKSFGEWGDRLSLEPGIFLMSRGGSEGKSHTIRVNYLQVPLNTKINFYFGDTRIFLGYGIYAACGLWGNTDFGDGKTPRKFGRNEYFRLLDVGAQAMIGMTSGRIGMNVMYQPGVRAITHKGDATNTSFMLNFTYLFSDPR